MAFQAVFCDNIGNTANQLHCCYADQQSSPICQADLYTGVPYFSGGCDGGDCIANCQNSTWLYESKIQDETVVKRGKWDSLPYADADIIGVGVFASYIMQCVFVTLLWFGLFGFEVYSRRKARRQTSLPHRLSDPRSQTAEKNNSMSTPSSSNPPRSHQQIFEDLVVQFHKAQCYFSATLQIASLSYGIFETDMLVTFILIPLATNGVLPIVFAFVMLFRCGRATMDVTMLTVFTYLLASIVYWILYSNIIPINAMMSDKRRYTAYQQFMYKLSAIDACGGYSALAVCPDNFVLGRQQIFDASHNLRVLTPIIWAYSTTCLIATLFGKVMKWRRSREQTDAQHTHQGHSLIPGEDSDDTPENHSTTHTTTTSVSHPHGAPPFLRSRLGASVTFWFTTTCFLAGIGMQLSSLAIGTSLNMMNRMHWSFGQIVAVTIWAEPLLGYLYNEGKLLLKSR